MAATETLKKDGGAGTGCANNVAVMTARTAISAPKHAATRSPDGGVFVPPRLRASSPLRGPGLTLLTAPSGFGKTTLMRVWYAQCTAEPDVVASWLSLERTDDTLDRFVVRLRAACRRFLTQPCADTATATLPEQALQELSDALERHPRAGVLFLDNLDRMPTPGPLFELIQRLPKEIRCVCASRRRLAWPLSKLRISGDAVILGAEELRFTREESANFLREFHELNLSPTDLTRLHEVADGWPIILSVLARAMAAANTTDIAGALEKVRGLLVDYLEEEVLLPLDPNTRDLLIKTAPLESVTGSLCNALTGRDDGPTILRSLEREHMILTAADSNGDWFRHRPLCRTVLQRYFEQLDANDRRATHRTASLWFERNGRPADAVRHALAAEEYERCADLLDTLALDAITSSRVTALLDWVRCLPEDTIRNHPVILVCALWGLFVTGHWDEVSRQLPRGRRVIESLLETEDPGQARTGRGWRDHLRLIAQVLEQRESAAQFDPQALLALRSAQAPDNHMLLGLIDIALARNYVQAGDMEEARARFSEAQFHSNRIGNVNAAVQAASGVAQVHYFQGRLDQALSISAQAVAGVDALPGGVAPVVAVPHLRMAEILFERNALSGAKEHLERSMISLEELGDPACARGAELLSVRITYAELGINAALARLHEIERAEALKGHGKAPLRRIYSLHATLLCQIGDLSGAHALLSMLAVPLTAPTGSAANQIPFWDEDTYLAAARYHIAAGKPAIATQWLTQLLRAARLAERRLSLVRIHGLLALAHEASGCQTHARRALREMLMVGEECGLMRSVTDLDPKVRTLIETFTRLRRTQPESVNISPTVGYLDRLLESHAEATSTAGVDSPPPGPMGRSPEQRSLTPRETEILHLLAEGLSNSAIADHLAIAQTTLKWHVRNMYGRLYVKSRTQAVAKARRLGLLH